MAPFFPLEAAKKGASTLWIGVISGTFDVSVFVVTIILSHNAKPEDFKFIYCTGQFGSGISMIGMGLIDLAPPNVTYPLLCCLARAFCGAFAALCWPTGYPLIQPLFEKQSGMVVSAIEVGFSAGILLGPSLGSLLFRIGGFMFSFFSAGIFEIVLGIFAVAVVSKISRDTNNSNSQTTSDATNSPFFTHLFSPRCFLVILPLFMSFVIKGFLDVSLSPFYNKAFGVAEKNMGYYYLFNSGPYMITALASGAAVDRGYGGMVTLASCAISPLAAWGFYLPHLFSDMENIYYFCFLMVLLGMCHGVFFITFYILLEKAVLGCGYEDYDNIKMNVAAVLLLNMTGSRAFGGMVFGGILFQNMPFYAVLLVLSLVNTTVSVLATVNIVKQNFHKQIFFDEFPQDTSPSEEEISPVSVESVVTSDVMVLVESAQ